MEKLNKYRLTPESNKNVISRVRLTPLLDILILKKGGSLMSEVFEMKRKPHETVYYKPNIGALRGKVGKSILETIMNTPKPDLSELRRGANECRTVMMADNTNGR